MTRGVTGTVYSYTEGEQQCDFCGQVAELRPYGPKGECVCFSCMKQNEDAAKVQFSKLLGDR